MTFVEITGSHEVLDRKSEVESGNTHEEKLNDFQGSSYVNHQVHRLAVLLLIFHLYVSNEGLLGERVPDTENLSRRERGKGKWVGQGEGRVSLNQFLREISSRLVVYPT